MIFRRSAPLIALLLVVGAAAGQVPGQVPGQLPGPPPGEPATARALVDVAVVHPGETFHVAIVFRIDPGWHVYWINPGAAGMPTEVTVTAPAGFTVGRPLFPRPQAFVEPEGTTFGYAKETAILVPVTAPADLADGAVALRVEASWLVCRRVCLLGSASPRLAPVPATSAPGPRRPADLGAAAPVIETARARLPRPLEGSGIEARFEDGTLTLTGPAAARGPATLFPLEAPGVFFGSPVVRAADGRFLIETPVEVRDDPRREGPPRLRGVIAPSADPDAPCYAFEIAIPEPAP